jgi:asparagine synthase (glutamine-hydrolysing)
MCGIAGVFGLGEKKINPDSIVIMTDTIAHRGPDGEGKWANLEQTISLGHRRLSILDLSANGKQPMHYADNRFTITFNGEIYNYLELKTLLETHGYSFYSKTDTEVLLAMYHFKGTDCLQYLEGMFAFAIWDEDKQELFCARDRFGEKPFFYTVFQEQFYFASEMKALFAAGVPKVVNNEMVLNYMVHSIVENPLNKSVTFYENIFKLEAAHFLVISKKGDITKKKYWDIDLRANSSLSLIESEDKFRELFYNAVKIMLRSDVPIGSSLSGGLDSSSVVAAINSFLVEGQKQKTFSARFSNSKFDEGRYMQMVIDQYGVDSHFTYPSESTVIDEFDKIIYHQEEPFVSASILAQWEVYKLAKQTGVTVLLDGQGADEILGGYHKYFKTYLRELFLLDKASFNRELAALNKLHNFKLGNNLRFAVEAYLPKLISKIGKHKRQLRSDNHTLNIDSDFYNTYKSDSPFTSFNCLNEFLKYDTTVYGLEKLLRFSDRNAMAHSREVRLPFLHHKLVEFIFSLPSSYKINSGWTKYILRTSIDQYLPKEITWRIDKMGYQAPQQDWEKNKKVKQRIYDSKAYLQSKNILNENSKIDNFKAIELACIV